ncbi:hypothetical protein ACFE04_003222 [Oxalis oulophora]
MYSCTVPALIFIFFLSLSFLITKSQSSPCTQAFADIIATKNITRCKKLPTLDAQFGWSYNQTRNHTQINIYFGTNNINPRKVVWLAWGVNPGVRPQMVGTRALIGTRHPDGSLFADSYNIFSDTKTKGCRLYPTEIDVKIQNKILIEYTNSTGFLTIYASLVLPMGYNISRLNHVWQVGYKTEGNDPKMHPKTLQHLDSAETIDLTTDASHGVGKHRKNLRQVHGILNIIGWGTLLPFGAIIARYLRAYLIELKSWYILHTTCQTIGYLIGTTGWAIGLWLGQASKYYTFHAHRMIAIFIFTFTTLQMVALRYKPGENEESRKNWNIYHHFLGYGLLVLIVVNIFEGISILKPYDRTWKWVYVGIIVLLGTIAVSFEVFTWKKFISEKKMPVPEEKQNISRNAAVQASESPGP